MSKYDKHLIPDAAEMMDRSDKAHREARDLSSQYLALKKVMEQEMEAATKDIREKYEPRLSELANQAVKLRDDGNAFHFASLGLQKAHDEKLKAEAKKKSKTEKSKGKTP